MNKHRFAAPNIVKGAEMPERIRRRILDDRGSSEDGAIVVMPPHMQRLTNYDDGTSATYWTISAWVFLDSSEKPYYIQSITIGREKDTHAVIAADFLEFIMTEYAGVGQ